MPSKKVNITLPNPNLLIPQVRLEGDWVRATRAIDRLGPSIKQGYDTATIKFSNQLLKIVKRAIGSGTPPRGGGVHWEPLSPNTIKRYKGKYPNHHLYYLTGLYYRSVGIFTYKSRTLVGLPINKKRSSQGSLTLNQLAKILEFGTGGAGDGGIGTGDIPARPLWAPSLKAVGGKDKLKKEILTSIRVELRRIGFKPNQVKW